jgi:hypothetical protein
LNQIDHGLYHWLRIHWQVFSICKPCETLDEQVATACTLSEQTDDSLWRLLFAPKRFDAQCVDKFWCYHTGAGVANKAGDTFGVEALSFRDEANQPAQLPRRPIGFHCLLDQV